MRLSRLVAVAVACACAPADAPQVPSPEAHFGFAPGAEGKLANWDQLTAYYEPWRRPATGSPWTRWGSRPRAGPS